MAERYMLVVTEKFRKGTDVRSITTGTQEQVSQKRSEVNWAGKRGQPYIIKESEYSAFQQQHRTGIFVPSYDPVAAKEAEAAKIRRQKEQEAFERARITAKEQTPKGEIARQILQTRYGIISRRVTTLPPPILTGIAYGGIQTDATAAQVQQAQREGAAYYVGGKRITPGAREVGYTGIGGTFNIPSGAVYSAGFSQYLAKPTGEEKAEDIIFGYRKQKIDISKLPPGSTIEGIPTKDYADVILGPSPYVLGAKAKEVKYQRELKEYSGAITGIGKLTPEEYAQHLEDIGKITYEPFSLEPGKISAYGFYQVSPAGKRIVIGTTIPHREETIAHELVHYKTPEILF